MYGENMNGKFVIAILFGVCATVCLSLPVAVDEKLTWDEFVDMVEGLKDSYRYDFVRNNYLIGYEIAHEDEHDIKTLQPADRLALAIFRVISENRERDVQEDILRFIRRDKICFPNIGCIDPGDPSLRPF